MTSVAISNQTRRSFVTQLNGQQIEVMHADERRFYQAQSAAYQREFSFTMVSDLTDLDRLLLLELQAFRFGRWVTSGNDYDDFDIPDGRLNDLRNQLRAIAADISKIKTDLGMNKSARDKESHDSVGAYIVELKRRAKQHGVNRNTQATKIICLMQELKSLVGKFDRSNQLEREKVGLETESDLIEWVRSYMIPEFDSVDDDYRKTTQQFFVGTL